MRTLAPPVLRALSMLAPAALAQAAVSPVQSVETPAPGGGIPEQSLARALEIFANQTGLQLVYVSDVVRYRKSHTVPPGLGAAAALTQLLQGTKLGFQYLTPRSIRILVVNADPPALADSTVAAGMTLEQVIVTANRREEYAHDVPMSMQVLTETTLARLNVTTFDDIVAHLPGVTAHGVGPSQNNIYVRGLATSTGPVQSSGVIGTFPNVSVYLDEQSAQLPNRNLDLYAADLERIEVLEGPQGTLFGAGAEAGVMRYITNKPKLDVTEAKLSVGSAMTAQGAESDNYAATLNVPVVAGKFAVRGVIYDERRGGYIDNRRADFARTAADPAIVSYFKGVVPQNSVVLSNADLAGKDINPVSYQGARLEALYRFSDDWTLLLSQAEQHFEADGIFTEMATDFTGQAQPDLTTQLYNASYDKDQFRSTALTLNGRLGELQLLYAGSYFSRKIEQLQDYTQYSRNPYAGYYQCVTPGPVAPTAQCFSPSATWRDAERNQHLSHELRLSTPQENRLSALGGLFFEDYRIHEQTDWLYATALPYFHVIGPPTGYYTLNGSPLLPDGTLVRYNTPSAVFVPSPVTSNNPNLRPPGDSFFDDITRGYTQKAAYASLDVAIVPKALLMTIGTRYSRTNTSELGSTVSGVGCGPYAGPDVPDPCLNHSRFYNLDAQHLDRTYSGFTSRANLTWKINDEAMLYYTWSQGFRAGGFNRSPIAATGGSPLAARGGSNQVEARLHGGYVAPVNYAPDSLTNNEIGWKMAWFNRRLQWTGALYQERWNDTQVNLSGLGVATVGVIINGGNYVVRGLETAAVARVGSKLTIEAGAAWNHSELVRQAILRWRDGTPIDFSILTDENGQPVPNPNGQLGTSLAAAPSFQGQVRARYEISYNNYGLFAQLAAKHQSHSYTSTFHFGQDLQHHSVVYDLPAFTTFDAALGFTRDAWQVQLYGENLGDTRAQLFAYYAASYKAVTLQRPRTIGLRIAYTFDGNTP